MNLTLLLLILRARFKIILVTFLAAVLAATVVSLLMPSKYRATTQVVFSYTALDPVRGSPLLAMQLPGYLDTQVDIIKNRAVALKVIDSLHLTANEMWREDFMEATEGRGQIREWIANMLMAKLEVAASTDSNVLNISYSSKDPRMAAAVVNAYARAYKEISTRLKVEPAQDVANYFGTQVKALRENLERAETRLSKYQQEKGITSVDERADVESARLADLSQQLVIAQSMAIEARSRQSNARGSGGDSPDVASSPVIQSLRIEAGRAASKLAEMSARLGTNHPQYEAAKAEYNKIQAQLQQEIRSASNSVSGSAQIHAQREADLRTQVAMQKARVLELNRLRDEMSVLQQDVQTAQKALDTATQRFTETSMEGQSNHSDVSILNEAIPPTSPYSPRIPLNIALASVLGLLMGLGLSFLMEMLDRRVRSSSDVVQLLKVPVVAMARETPAIAGLRMLPGPSHPGKYLPSP